MKECNNVCMYPYLMNCLRGCFTTGSCAADAALPAMSYDSVREQLLVLSARDYYCTGAGLPQAAIIAIIVCSCVAGLALIAAAIWYAPHAFSDGIFVTIFVTTCAGTSAAAAARPPPRPTPRAQLPPPLLW
jgi:hypothetical protein